jgi:hypothetical protein
MKEFIIPGNLRKSENWIWRRKSEREREIFSGDQKTKILRERERIKKLLIITKK